MTKDDLIYFQNWFDDYTKSFYSSNKEDQRNIILKVEHTQHVRNNMREIVNALCLNENVMMLAETIALFHDIGRYDQYAKYRTFKDADSENHGYLGAKVLSEEKVLKNLPENEQNLIVQSVKFHGAFAIPGEVDENTVFFLKLIRDADKLDIYRVFIEYYESPDEKRASATAFGVPDTHEYSGIMLDSIFREQIGSYSNIRTENDFRLMKLSWVYDINFDITLDLLLKRNCLNSIISKLPQTGEICDAVEYLKKYISMRMQNVKKN